MPIIDGLEMISLILIVVCFLFQCVSFYFGLLCVRWSVPVYVCLHDYIVTKYLNSC